LGFLVWKPTIWQPCYRWLCLKRQYCCLQTQNGMLWKFSNAFGLQSLKLDSPWNFQHPFNGSKCFCFLHDFKDFHVCKVGPIIPTSTPAVVLDSRSLIFHILVISNPQIRCFLSFT
jgi:hypothetical protein